MVYMYDFPGNAKSLYGAFLNALWRFVLVFKTIDTRNRARHGTQTKYHKSQEIYKSKLLVVERRTHEMRSIYTYTDINIYIYYRI